MNEISIEDKELMLEILAALDRQTSLQNEIKQLIQGLGK